MNAARWRPRLASTIDVIVEAAAHFEDDWWIIGSAAAALAGADIAEIRDVDLLLSANDAKALKNRWEAFDRGPPPANDQFRSQIFAAFNHASLKIEAFGGFEMKIRGRWRPVEPLTRRACGKVFIPTVGEQIAILEVMGRNKDFTRISALRLCLSHPA